MFINSFALILTKNIFFREPEKSSTLVLNKNGIEMQLFIDTTFASSANNDEATIRLISVNNNPVFIENFNFQAAVTKVYIIKKI